MPNPPVAFDVTDGVATVRIDRPDAMCALDLATKEGLLAALRSAAQDPAARVVVLTGTGRAFCVGQDLKEHVEGLKSGQVLSDTVVEHYNPIVELLATMPKPVIAAVNGVAAGAGASFAFACDLRILADTAGFNTAFSAIALSCDSGASWHLPRLVGVAKAKQLLLMPRTIPADEALELGLATTVIPADTFADEVAKVARTLADGPTAAYGAIRQAVEYSAGHDLTQSLAFEADKMRLTGATEDHRAAVDAFLAKEKPSFNGR
ncbi:enoyl-CoA hydratase [Calidifontibacter sp. DB0510]|uniref:Enoyl-CoA hydratase n=1 Tax=Metallococcus carri TaxID=1656884 RepID=A0A967B5L2_9MICO|nr:enoyl-CoA hydratase-related protein [Metallococcus carri]NHN55061.1 enoyl-CoA hydratase [Metallococcus carri]NOP36138.1 enoyl-CoA hydratase [Calidifontibacter sp. DB2511S]